jgi:hypothetical protein
VRGNEATETKRLTEYERAVALTMFTEYFVKNYPGPRTIISDPRWHAERIFRAAENAILSQIPAVAARNSHDGGREAPWPTPRS